MADKEVVETSEAQIAVHWQEEGLYYPTPKFIAQANMTDEKIYDRFSLDNFPNCFKEYADLLDVVQVLGRNPGYQRRALLQVVQGRPDQRQLQLRGSPPGKVQEQGGLDFAPEPDRGEGYHPVTYQELYVRVNEFAALLRDFAGLKRGDRVTLHLPMIPELPITMLACARLGRHSLPGVRRVQRPRLCRPYRRLRQPGVDHGRRVLPQRHPARPQAECRHRRRSGRQGRSGGRQGPRLAALPGQGLQPDSHGQGPGLSSSTTCSKTTTASGSNRKR